MSKPIQLLAVPTTSTTHTCTRICATTTEHSNTEEFLIAKQISHD